MDRDKDRQADQAEKELEDLEPGEEADQVKGGRARLRKRTDP